MPSHLGSAMLMRGKSAHRAGTTVTNSLPHGSAMLMRGKSRTCRRASYLYCRSPTCCGGDRPLIFRAGIRHVEDLPRISMAEPYPWDFFHTIVQISLDNRR